jgi:hypothetical protein
MALCAADTTLETLDPVSSWAGYGVMHQCRDFKQLMAVGDVSSSPPSLKPMSMRDSVDMS